MRFDFKFERDKIIVEPVITGKSNSLKFRFFLDTGASVTVIDSSVATVFDFEYNYDDKLVTASGRAKSKKVTIPEMELFCKKVSDFWVNVIDFPYQITLFADGLLGMDFLKQFKYINIDFENQIIDAE
jgi:clan AA aspartic protease (TIGR02281 family)